MRSFLIGLMSAALATCPTLGIAQNAATPPTEVPVSVDAQLLLDAAGPEQRESLGAIYLIACRSEAGLGVGTGFLLTTGVLVTNSHVVGSCTETSLVGVSPKNDQIRFSKIIRDADRDLAILKPASKLAGGLKLSTKDDPEPGTTVTTWGYPFAYNGVSPLLSVGYVSGFRAVKSNNHSVKHIVVNGAFNHGNSGGPLLVARDNEVIGVVVLTFNFYPPGMRRIIDDLSNQHSGMQWTLTLPDGKTQTVTEAQLTAAVLNEFYEKTQVMIGEAVASSELAALLNEHSGELN